MFMVAGLAGIAVFFALPSGVENLWYDLIGLGCLVAMIIGIWRYRPTYRLPWVLLVTAISLQVAGDLTWDYYALVLDEDPPLPSLADAFYLPGLALAPVAFLLMNRRRTGGRDRGSGVDAAIIATGVAVLAWVFLIAPSVAASNEVFAESVMALAYPTVDVFFVAILASLLFQPGARPVALKLFAAGFALAIVSDVVYSWMTLNSADYVPGGILDAGWLLWYVVWGVAALHPSMRVIGEPLLPLPSAEAALSRKRLALLSAATLLAPVTLAVQAVRGTDLHLPVVVAGSMVLFLLVIWRLRLLVRSLEGALAERDALQAELVYSAFHDTVTGLPNRALFYRHLEGALMRQASGNADVAVLFVDLDDFKHVNDAQGHHAGDRLLAEIGRRISSCVRSTDVTARIGGDEFTVMLAGAVDRGTATLIAERIIARVQAPISIGDEMAIVGASVGIALVADAPVEPQQLLRDADRAMYAAKRAGKGRWVIAGERDDADGSLRAMLPVAT